MVTLSRPALTIAEMLEANIGKHVWFTVASPSPTRFEATIISLQKSPPLPEGNTFASTDPRQNNGGYYNPGLILPNQPLLALLQTAEGTRALPISQLTEDLSRSPCYIPWYSCIISTDGDVYPCCYHTVRGTRVGKSRVGGRGVRDAQTRSPIERLRPMRHLHAKLESPFDLGMGVKVLGDPGLRLEDHLVDVFRFHPLVIPLNRVV